MEKIWLQSYPPNIPHTVDTNEYSSLADLIDDACIVYRDKPALTNMGTTLTYGQLSEKSNHLAAYLQKTLKLQKGDRLAIMLPNLLQYPIILLAALRLGLIIINLNPLYTERELLLPLQDSKAKAIIVLANFAATVKKIFNQTDLQYVVTTQVADDFSNTKRFLVNSYLKYIKKAVPSLGNFETIKYRQALREGKHLFFDKVKVNAEDLAFLQYTGGTTGTPKGAMLTHGNMVANVLQCLAWINIALKKGEEIIVTALPLYHIFSLTVCCLAFLRLGGLLLLITNPRDIKSLIKEQCKYPFTVFVGVNTLYQALLNHKDFNSLDFSHLKLALAGGMSIMKPVAQEWQARTQKTIVMGYGLTEASPVVTINLLSVNFFTGSIGLPIPGTDVRLIDDQGMDVAVGMPGELCVSGPQVMPGYWHQPEQTKQVFIDKHWLRTGDICYMDEQGYLYLIDRKKDMILVSGFNVYPQEVEEVIISHPSVKEAAVIGIPDSEHGEIIKAYIVRKDPSLSAEEIQAFCKHYLTNYKQPKIIEFCQELPKSNIGKVLKRELRARISESNQNL